MGCGEKSHVMFMGVSQDVQSDVQTLRSLLKLPV